MPEVESRERRAYPKLVRFTAGELDQVIANARAAGRPVACYIRECSLGARPRAKARAGTDQLVHRLGVLGTHLATATRAATEAGLPAAGDLQDALGQLLDTIRSIE